MEANANGKIIKCDQKVNITATFGSDLVLEGSTSIPNILLKVYRRIGISDLQMMLLIQLIRLSVEEKEYCPSPEMIARQMEAEPLRIKKELADLLEKEIISVSDYFDSSKDLIFEGYDFEPLFLKVSDIWAGVRAAEIQESEKLLKSKKYVSPKFCDKTTEIILVFEKEFGRPLSPIEIEQVEQWLNEIEPLLVVEALKRAVLRGKHNFKYINSIIVEWKKNNLHTMESIEQYDRDFLNRRSERRGRSVEKAASSGSAGSKDDSKKKAFIRSLYI